MRFTFLFLFWLTFPTLVELLYTSERALSTRKQMFLLKKKKTVSSLLLYVSPARFYFFFYVSSFIFILALHLNLKNIVVIAIFSRIKNGKILFVRRMKSRKTTSSYINVTTFCLCSAASKFFLFPLPFYKMRMMNEWDVVWFFFSTRYEKNLFIFNWELNLEIINHWLW